MPSTLDQMRLFAPPPKGLAFLMTRLRPPTSTQRTQIEAAWAQGMDAVVEVDPAHVYVVFSHTADGAVHTEAKIRLGNTVQAAPLNPIQTAGLSMWIGTMTAQLTAPSPRSRRALGAMPTSPAPEPEGELLPVTPVLHAEAEVEAAAFYAQWVESIVAHRALDAPSVRPMPFAQLNERSRKIWTDVPLQRLRDLRQPASWDAAVRRLAARFPLLDPSGGLVFTRRGFGSSRDKMRWEWVIQDENGHEEVILSDSRIQDRVEALRVALAEPLDELPR